MARDRARLVLARHLGLDEHADQQAERQVDALIRVERLLHDQLLVLLTLPLRQDLSRVVATARVTTCSEDLQLLPVNKCFFMASLRLSRLRDA